MRFAKANPDINGDIFALYPRKIQRVDALGQIVFDLFDRVSVMRIVLHGFGAALHMHDDNAATKLCGQPFGARIKGERSHVVPNISARKYRRLRHLWLARINRDNGSHFMLARRLS